MISVMIARNRPVTASVFELFKIGPGPSSSHTIGPMAAAKHFIQSVKRLKSSLRAKATDLSVNLFGSLSATGRGHGTDRAVLAGLLGMEPETCPPDLLLDPTGDPSRPPIVDLGPAELVLSPQNVVFDAVEHDHPHSNTLVFRLLGPDRDAPPLLEREYYSVGGGFIQWKGWKPPKRGEPVLPYSTMRELLAHAEKEGLGIHEIIIANERAVTGKEEREILDKADRILGAMEDAVGRGLAISGPLPGPIGLERKAGAIFNRIPLTRDKGRKLLLVLNAAAFAASEENASGGRVVTAPTSGSSGVIPALAHVMRFVLDMPFERVREGLFVGAAVGFLARHNASISGAEVGCQGEIGVAASMGAAMLAHASGHGASTVENAAQTALEHHLGMTCDPILGYVQIPCIERNAMGAVKALNSVLIASSVPNAMQRLGLDETIAAMSATGRAMPREYKETALGGLAACHIC